jgi:hypothetical protein
VWRNARRQLLVIVNLSSKEPSITADTLSLIDSALESVGLRKQVRSVVVPGKEYTVTYDGPTVEKRRIEAIVGPLAEGHHIAFSIEVEESVSFP